MTTEYSLRMEIAHLNEIISDYEADVKSLQKRLDDERFASKTLSEHYLKLEQDYDKLGQDYDELYQDLCLLDERHENLLTAYRQLYKKWWDSNYLPTDEDELPF